MAHAAHNVVWRSLLLFTVPIILSALVYKDKGKPEYEDAGELSGLSFELVAEF